MLKKILIGLVLVVAMFLIIVALQPSEFRVTRSATISAPPSAIFPHVNDLHSWQAWSPWAKLDPAARNSFEGPAAGQGAAFSWAGNNDVGEGKMTVTGSRPDELVQLHLEFFKPMAGTSEAEFTFQPDGPRTKVTWTMTGRNNFIAKGMCLFMNMDKMVGGSFEQGLVSLKAIAEKPAQP